MRQELFTCSVTVAGIRVYITAGRGVLHSVSFSSPSSEFASARRVSPNNPEVKPFVSAIANFLNGKSTTISVKYQFSGTPFQQSVWRQIARIPYGKTLSYGAIAAKIANPGAFRAVGTACGKNPLPLVIPCHRVLAANGKIGGFSGGVHIKKKLLRAEGVAFSG